MRLNTFVWNNYKQTNDGQEAIQLFSSRKSESLITRFATNLPIEISAAISIVDDLTNFCSTPNLPATLNWETAEKLFQDVTSNGIKLTYEEGDTEQIDPETFDFLQLVPILSTWLYLNYPDKFKPYFFNQRFHILHQIADTFGINLPEVPLKRYKEQRLFYYFQLCKTFADFQEENNLSAAEFCAFLYDFAPKYLEQNPNKTSEPLPQPTQVWWIGGDKGGGDFEFLDSAKPDAVSRWQGHEDTKRGDILVMYCLAPRSYIHSVWRSTADGIADPFFHYYSSTFIGHGQKVPPISIHELKADPHFSKNPLVRKNLQGINGYPMTSEDYQQLQNRLASKGFDVATLPQLYSHIYEQNQHLKTEREVELSLIEPLLQRIGFAEMDWVRQLPVRMGRGERNFPDYVFLSDKTIGYEKATMLIESKYLIKNNRELEETFKQAWSYGQRLEANVLVLADKDAIWVYDKKKRSAFDRTDYLKLFWKELEHPEKYNQLRHLIGKQAVFKKS